MSSLLIFSSKSKCLFPANIFLLFTLAITPLPGIILNSSGILISLLYVSLKDDTMAFPRGCSEYNSHEAIIS